MEIGSRISFSDRCLYYKAPRDGDSSGNPMIKTTKNEARIIDAAEEKALVCWNKDAQAQSLRVEFNSDDFYLFPYTHLVYAKMEHHGARETLTVSFTTHDLCIAGKNLRELGIAFQKLSVDWVRAVPKRYAALAVGNGVLIELIEVKETSE